MIAGTCLAGVATLFATSEAKAQSRTFTLDRAQLSGAPDDGFMVFRPYMHKETRFYGNFALGYALNPLRKDALTNDGPQQNDIEDPVSGQFGIYPSAGIELVQRLGLNLSLPFVPYQFTGTDPLTQGDIGEGGLTGTRSTFGDVRLDARFLAWESSDRRTRLGFVAGLMIPTGTKIGFGGDPSTSGILFASAEKDFGGFLLTGHIGPHFRPESVIPNDRDPSDQLWVSSELRYAIGGFFPLRDGRLRLGAEIWGSTGIAAPGGVNTFFNIRNTTVEWLAQARIQLTENKRFFANFGGGTRLSGGYGAADLRLLASIGGYWTMKDLSPPAPPPKVLTQSKPEFYDEDQDKDGYPDALDQCPDVPEDKKAPDPSDGCPAPVDSDGDGIFDQDDKCPNAKEDFDGLGDTDGCPEPDFDNDKVDDAQDACPEEPGPPNKRKDENGCPTLTKVTEDGHIAILKSIEFERGKAKISEGSYPILDEVVLLMKARPNLLVAVHGHTDNRGREAYNIQLSSERAAAVVQYLIDHGVEKDRLSSTGFGPTKPIDSNDTEAGRAKNRRVEFVTSQRGEEKPAE